MKFSFSSLLWFCFNFFLINAATSYLAFPHYGLKWWLTFILISFTMGALNKLRSFEIVEEARE
jgi:hypothetical protein